MLDCAACDRTAQFDDLFGDRPRIGVVESLQCGLADAIEVGVVAPDQLDEDRFLRLEVVIETAREDPRGIGDLLQRGAQTRRCDDGVRGLQDLGAPGRVAAGGSATAVGCATVDFGAPVRRRLASRLIGVPSVAGTLNALGRKSLPTPIDERVLDVRQARPHPAAQMLECISRVHVGAPNRWVLERRRRRCPAWR